MMNHPTIAVERMPVRQAEPVYPTIELGRADLPTIKAGTKTGRCGDFVEQLLGIPLNSTYSDDARYGLTVKLKFADKTKGVAENPIRPGDAVVFDDGTRDGHIAVIKEAQKRWDGKPWYVLAESNVKGDWLYSEDRMVWGDDPTIKGVIPNPKHKELEQKKKSLPAGWTIGSDGKMKKLDQNSSAPAGWTTDENGNFKKL